MSPGRWLSYLSSLNLCARLRTPGKYRETSVPYPEPPIFCCIVVIVDVDRDAGLLMSGTPYGLVQCGDAHCSFTGYPVAVVHTIKLKGDPRAIHIDLYSESPSFERYKPYSITSNWQHEYRLRFPGGVRLQQRPTPEQAAS